MSDHPGVSTWLSLFVWGITVETAWSSCWLEWFWSIHLFLPTKCFYWTENWGIARSFGLSLTERRNKANSGNQSPCFHSVMKRYFFVVIVLICSLWPKKLEFYWRIRPVEVEMSRSRFCFCYLSSLRGHWFGRYAVAFRFRWRKLYIKMLTNPSWNIFNYWKCQHSVTLLAVII